MIGPNDLLRPSPTPHFKTFHVFLIYCPKRPSFSTIQSHAPNVDNTITVVKCHFGSKFFEVNKTDFWFVGLT
jgi:hypothetical protein